MSSSAFLRVNCFNVRLSVDKQTSASWHKDAGTKTAQFTTKRWSGQTQILFKLKACSNLRGMRTNFLLFLLRELWYCLMFYGYDEIVFYAYYFIFSVYCFWLKDNEMIFGCIGLTDTVVCSNLSYSCSVCCLCNNCLTRDALCYLEKKMDSRIISV